MTTSIKSIISHGADGLPVDIECHLSNSLPNIVIVGAATRTVDEAKERLRGAFSNTGLLMPRKRISINLAPADVPKDSSSLDLPIAVAILDGSDALPIRPAANEIFIGELGLNGQVRPVRGVIGKLLSGRKHGFKRFYIPVGNLRQAQIVPGLELVAVASLRQIYDHYNSVVSLPAVFTKDGIINSEPASRAAIVSLYDISGQAQAKRALAVAAAGGHNILLKGPPGTGKSMLAKALVSILPPLSQEEMLEVTHLQSLSGYEYDKLITERPVRAPHHSASHIAIVGGGNAVRPGEVSLAHRGVLFFDELPEFQRATVEALRQPLEDKTITVTRVRENITFPANFIFIATANPCPCGYHGVSSLHEKLCDCTAAMIGHYRRKLSGPLLDRIDLHVTVEMIKHTQLLNATPLEDDTASTIKLVNRARHRQAARFGSSHKLNSDMDNADIKRRALLDPTAKQILDTASYRLRLSARAYMRSLKVARTIADLDDSDGVLPRHITEALQFREQSANIR